MLIAIYVLGSAAAVAVTALCAVSYLNRGVVSLARLEGRKEALREAIETTKERGDVAVLCAPEGELTVGLIRAQAANAIEMDLRDLLARAH